MLSLRARILEIFAKAKHEKSPEAEADLILLHAFRRDLPGIHSHPELRLKNPASTLVVEEEALRIVAERLKGIPLQHLLGVQFFYEHEYLVDDSTLIPRPETEILVREIIEWAKLKFEALPFQFAELGIGSGIISSEILAHFKNAKAIASEPSSLAIALARQNLLSIIGPNIDERITILEPEHTAVGFEIFLPHAPFDVIVSNPPYLSVNDEIDKEVALHEPRLALFPTLPGDYETPNYFYENFLIYAKQLLKPDGIVFFEVPHERADAIHHEFTNGGFKSVRLIADLTGRSRVLQASFS